MLFCMSSLVVPSQQQASICVNIDMCIYLYIYIYTKKYMRHDFSEKPPYRPKLKTKPANHTRSPFNPKPSQAPAFTLHSSRTRLYLVEAAGFTHTLQCFLKVLLRIPNPTPVGTVIIIPKRHHIRGVYVIEFWNYELPNLGSLDVKMAGP